MKAFVITIMSENESVEMAQRCCASFKRHNPDHVIEVFTAITTEDQQFSLVEKWKICRFENVLGEQVLIVSTVFLDTF